MSARINRPVKRLAAMSLLVLLTVAVSTGIYSIFLYLDDDPRTRSLADRVIRHLAMDQRLLAIDLDLDVDPDTGRLDAVARIRCSVNGTGRSSLIERFVPRPADLVFRLHPEIEVDRVRFGDRHLEFIHVKDQLFVNLEGATPLDDEVELTVDYHARALGEGWKSIVNPALVFLDPEDRFYPLNDDHDIDVRLHLRVPAGFTAVLPGEPAEETLKDGLQSFRTVFRAPRASFAVAAGPFDEIAHEVPGMRWAWYGWSGEEKDIVSALERIVFFYRMKLPPPAHTALRIIRSPFPLPGGLRFDETGTVLMTPGIPLERLARLQARFWIEEPGEGIDPVFSREELAEAMALYFLQIRESNRSYLKALSRLSRDPAGGTAGLLAGLTPGAPSGLAGTDPTWDGLALPGAPLLSILRKLVGYAAFDALIKEMLSEPTSSLTTPWMTWAERCRPLLSGDDMTWFFRDWAHEGKTLDLALLDFSVENRQRGHTVHLTLKNKGDLDLPEKVKIKFVTLKGEVEMFRIVPRSEITLSVYLQDRLKEIVLDPEMEWYDRCRDNNRIFVEPPACLAMPSEDNRYLAAAYYKRSHDAPHRLVIRTVDGGTKQIYGIDHAIRVMRWIGKDRLLAGGTPATGGSQGLWRSSYAGSDLGGLMEGPISLVDTQRERAEFLPRDVRVSPSTTGRFLIINRLKGKVWHHQLRDLDRRFTRKLLNRVPQPLRWLEGLDLIMPVYPADYAGEVRIYTSEGDVAYSFTVGRNARLYRFFGFGDDLAFIMEQDGFLGLYTLNTPEDSPELRLRLAGEPEQLELADGNETLFLRERLEGGRIRILRLDRGKQSERVLFEGDGRNVYPLFCKQGLLVKKKRYDDEGNPCEDIYFQSFTDEDSRFITRSPAPEQVLALVSNQRYLYYAEELEDSWSDISASKRYLFYWYDLHAGERKQWGLRDG